MQIDTFSQIEERLKQLPPEKLTSVLDFVTFLWQQSDIIDEDGLEEEYRAMANDLEREREALEWIEAAPDEALE
jgi:Protein of unknown function (DUF2281)